MRANLSELSGDQQEYLRDAVAILDGLKAGLGRQVTKKLEERSQVDAAMICNNLKVGAWYRYDLRNAEERKRLQALTLVRQLSGSLEMAAAAAEVETWRLRLVDALERERDEMYAEMLTRLRAEADAFPLSAEKAKEEREKAKEEREKALVLKVGGMLGQQLQDRRSGRLRAEARIRSQIPRWQERARSLGTYKMTRPAGGLYTKDRDVMAAEFPFTLDNALFMEIYLGTLFSPLDSLALQGLVKRLDENVVHALDQAEIAYDELRNVVAAQEAQDAERAKLVGKIVGGGLGLLGPLGVLAGGVIANVSGAIIDGINSDAFRSALGEAVTWVKAQASDHDEQLKEALDKAREKIIDQVESRASKYLEVRRGEVATYGQLELKAQMRDKLRDFVRDMYAMVLTSVLSIVGHNTASLSPLVAAYLKDAKAAPAPPRKRYELAVDYLWSVHENDHLGHLHRDRLVEVAQNYVAVLMSDALKLLVERFRLDQIPELTASDKQNIHRLFGLKVWSHHVLETFADYRKIELGSELVAALEKLGIVAKYDSSASAQARAYLEGRVRYGARHVSVNESARVRLMLEYIRDKVNPLEPALSASEPAYKRINEGLKLYARAIEDSFRRLKDAGGLPSDSEENVCEKVKADIQQHASATPAIAASATWSQDTSNCEKCNRSFGLLTRRHHCRLCGKCICESCSTERVIANVAYLAQHGKVRVCARC